MLTESEPHFRQPLLRTPFHERARAASQLDSFVPWSGYTTVDVFSTVEQEYFAIRNATSLYDLTPMVKYRIAGHGALPFLNRLMTRDLRKLAPGKVAYSVWCDDAGRLIDDGTVFCLAANEYRLCTAERQLDWLEASAVGFDVEIAEITEEIAALAVQGPTSCALLKALEKQPAKRQQTAQELLRDMQGAAGSAPGSPFRAHRWTRRELALTVAASLAAIAATGYALWPVPAPKTVPAALV